MALSQPDAKPGASAVAGRLATCPTTNEPPWVEGLTIGGVLRQTAQRFASREAIVFPQAETRLTWAEFDRQVDRIARGLLTLGFRPGDHFGVWSTNWPEWVLLQFATARIGVVLVTINPAYRAAELQYVLAQSEVRGLALIERFKSSDYFAILREVVPELDSSVPGGLQSTKFPHLQWVVRIRGAASHRSPLPLGEGQGEGCATETAITG
jgi:fatty-acyl-CoA synthase